jgi:hypothetical protein
LVTTASSPSRRVARALAELALHLREDLLQLVASACVIRHRRALTLAVAPSGSFGNDAYFRVHAHATGGGWIASQVFQWQ